MICTRGSAISNFCRQHKEEIDAFDSALDEAMQWAEGSDRLMVLMDGNGSVGIGEKGDSTLGPHGLR